MGGVKGAAVLGEGGKARICRKLRLDGMQGRVHVGALGAVARQASAWTRRKCRSVGLRMNGKRHSRAGRALRGETQPLP